MKCWNRCATKISIHLILKIFSRHVVTKSCKQKGSVQIARHPRTCFAGVCDTQIGEIFIKLGLKYHYKSFSIASRAIHIQITRESVWFGHPKLRSQLNGDGHYGDCSLSFEKCVAEFRKCVAKVSVDKKIFAVCVMWQKYLIRLELKENILPNLSRFVAPKAKRWWLIRTGMRVYVTIWIPPPGCGSLEDCFEIIRKDRISCQVAASGSCSIIRLEHIKVFSICVHPLMVPTSDTNTML